MASSKSRQSAKIKVEKRARNWGFEAVSEFLGQRKLVSLDFEPRFHAKGFYLERGFQVLILGGPELPAPGWLDSDFL